VLTSKPICSLTSAMKIYIETTFHHIMSPSKLVEQQSSCPFSESCFLPWGDKFSFMICLRISPLILVQQIHTPANCLIKFYFLLGTICLPMTTPFVFYFSAIHFSFFICFYHATCTSHFSSSFFPKCG
jgi:hypothetical protein